MFGNILVSVFATYYTKYILSLIISKQKRQKVKTTNIRLDELRKIPVKTLEEQKEFINLRYPKRKGKFKFSWKMIPTFLINMGIFVGLFFIYRNILLYFNLDFELWQGILLVVIGPMIINYLLEKAGVQKASLLVFFR